jgi:Spy/CpxP family protein refolding chaperone
MALPPCRYLTLAVALALGAVPAVWTAAAEGAESEQGEAGAGEPAGPTIYKWIDEHGIAHYPTDFERIPEDLRKRSGPLGPPNAALTRTPVAADAPARSGPPAAGADHGERWAVQDRSFDRPSDTWDEGAPYAHTPGSEPGGDGAFAGDSGQREQRRQIEDLDQRIASLRTDIAANEEALKALISIPVAEGGGSLAMADNPNFREIADRLPELLKDLRALEDERAQLEAP